VTQRTPVIAHSCGKLNGMLKSMLAALATRPALAPVQSDVLRTNSALRSVGLWPPPDAKP